MLAIRKIQWLISLSVLIYGVALFGGLGVTAIIFVGVGLVYCALAFWASRLTILPLSTTVVADSMLAQVSWRLLVSTLESVPVNARFQGREVGFVDYLNLDGVASVIVLALVGLYIVVITLKLKELRKQNWL